MKIAKILLAAISFGLAGTAIAQQGERWNPSERIAKEKSAILERVTDLNDDQHLIFDQIYQEYETAVVDLRKTGDFQTMRAEMPEIRKKKDEAIKDLFTPEQYKLYEEVVNKRYERLHKPGDSN